jgi:hypothetical protein
MPSHLVGLREHHWISTHQWMALHEDDNNKIEQQQPSSPGGLR